MSEYDEVATNLRTRALSSLRWTFFRFGFTVVLQVVNMAILARILSPEDFGDAAPIILTLAFCDLFLHSGLDTSLMRERDQIDVYLPAAWTFRILRGFVLGGVVFGLSYPIGAWQQSELTGGLMRLAALAPCIDGFQSLSFVLLGRSLKQKPIFIFEVTTIVLAGVGSIALALFIGNAYAIITNLLFFSVIRTVGSFMIHPHRPRLTRKLGILKRFVRFGFFYNLAGGVAFLNYSIDKFLIGAQLTNGAHFVGLYERVFTLACYANNHVSKILASTAFPAFSSIQREPARVLYHSKRFLWLSALSNLGLALALLALAPLVIEIVLGDEYLAVVPVFRILCVLTFTRGFESAINVILDVFGHSRIRFFAGSIQFIALLALLPFALKHGGLLGAAASVALASLAHTVFVFGAVMRELSRLKRTAIALELKSNTATPEVEVLS